MALSGRAVVLAMLVCVCMASSSPCGKGYCSETKGGGIKISWDVIGDEIVFTVGANTSGWIGLGFSPDSHKMYYSDYLIVSKETKSSAWVISDRYNLDERNVPVYESKQDGVLLSAKQEGFWQTVSFKRKIDTYDEHDVSFKSTGVLLWAFGAWNSQMSSASSSFREHQYKGHCDCNLM